MELKTRLMVLAAVLAAATLAVFTAVALSASHADLPSKITIAYQPGLGYAPLILMKQQRVIEKKYPGTTVDWKVLSSGTPITNGVITGDIEIGAVGTGPFLVGWARGVNWKVIAPLNLGDLWLMAKDPNIKTIADLKGKRIATPTNTSIQAVALRKMAQVKLGDAKALDSGLVALDHPDGMQALLTGQIDAHFTSPPFQFQEKVRGAHIVGKSYSYFGAHTFLVTVMTQKFYDEHTAFGKFFYNAVAAAQTQIKKNPDKVAHILQDDAGGTPTWRQFKQWLVAKDPGLKVPALTWTTRPLGMMRTANFMVKTNQLSKMPNNWKDLFFPPVYPTKGS
jgi:ABC-type nitrate/sulfonate/bicarbonate transport system substrate-binding protein